MFVSDTVEHQAHPIVLLKTLKDDLINGNIVVDGHNNKVRILGVLKHYDSVDNRALIEDEGSVLHIDTSLLGQFGAKINTYYTFLGEIENAHAFNNVIDDNHEVMTATTNVVSLGNCVLRARVAHEMEGMDTSSIKVWKRCLQVREKYLLGVGDS